MSSALWVPFTVPDAVPGIEARSGRGSTVVTSTGEELLDFASGLWNVGFGYDDAALADAVRAQLERLAYYPTFRDMRSEVAAQLADALVALAGTPDARVVLGTGGGSAVDVALKLVSVARRDGLCVSLAGSYHGTMYGGSAVSGQDLLQQRTRAAVPWVRHVAPNDCDGFRALARTTRLSCVVLEPVLGNGCLPLTPAFVDCVYEECRRQGALVVADEVATGCGRTGPLFASSSWPEPPDLLLVSKLLTGGVLPLSAVLVQPRVWEVFRDEGVALPHGETQGGNPLACAAALEVLRRWADPGFRAAVQVRARAFEEWTAAGPWGLAAVAGRGFMQAVSLDRAGVLPGATPEQRALTLETLLRASGLRTYVGGDLLCLFPPLTVTDDELDLAHDIVARTWKVLA